MGLDPIVRLHLTEEHQQLRSDVRTWLDVNLADEFRHSTANADYLPEDSHRRAVEFCRALHAQGWFVPHWPAEHEGGGLGIAEQMIIREQLAYAGAPLVNSNGTNMLAPILFSSGTEEQKARYLPAIARSEEMWAQGYSEPEAGSDLAALRMTARRDGDEYVVNGQKTWTSNGRLADWMFVLVRTDPHAAKPQAGISFLLVDFRAPGITIRPIRSLTGYPTFAKSSSMTSACRSRTSWAPSTMARASPRSCSSSNGRTSRAAQSQRYVDELIDWCRKKEGAPDDPLRSESNRIALTRLVEKVEIGRVLSYRIAQLQAHGGMTSSLASLSKLFHAEFAFKLRRGGRADPRASRRTDALGARRPGARTLQRGLALVHAGTASAGGRATSNAT